MQHFKYVIVVLVYRNTRDILDFIKSVKKAMNSFQIIMVNSFFDEKSKSDFEEIAKAYHCDFVNVENKGYSYGNNCGIRFAKSHYSFDYLICSNPDIVIREFNPDIMKKYPGQIYGPDIMTKSKRKQNPMMVKYNKFSYFMIYHGYRQNIRFFIFMGMGINKVFRILAQVYMKLFHIRDIRVFQLHGSFLIFSKEYVLKNEQVFDENFFLFGEEGVLAVRAARAGTNLYYSKDMKVFHKEDGSMKLFTGNLDGEVKKSNLYFYENYIHSLF